MWFLKMDTNRRRTMLSWLFVGTLFVLCGVLGVLQYRWIGEVSLAERDRLKSGLHASLVRLSQDFNSEVSAACRDLLPSGLQPGTDDVEAALAASYAHWRKTSRHAQMFRRIGVVFRQDHDAVLRTLDLERGTFETAEWPASWLGFKERIETRFRNRPWAERGSQGPPRQIDDGLTFELPAFMFMAMPRGDPPRGDPPAGPFPRWDIPTLLIEMNLSYVRGTLMPELLQRHLGAGGNLEYVVEVVSRGSSPSIIYQSDPHQAKRIDTSADASVNLFDLQMDQILRMPAPPGGRGRGPQRAAGEMGRWQMFARHRAGSLEVVVSQARWRNLAVNAGILLLMLASVAALIRYTRSAQKLAQVQMEFVASVSHELRTPLTVIRTAAYNLRGRLANNPTQVERYGALIQQESGRLSDLVEQVLRFASAKAGRVIRDTEPLCVESIINDTVESSKAVIEGNRCVVEKRVDPKLPLILGDAMSLKHALQNLISNAVKYGTEGSNWIGISATTTGNPEPQMVEIRVADRGPGIPPDEQRHIFDPFFRGKRALRDQIHGTGLGLSLVKEIVEAHGGTIMVHSEPAKGTEFVVQIPVAPPEQQDEFANSID